ncbi:hypothetical protein SAMN06297129_2442 [Pseudooceanicola antarcticus]|uniref:Uncharacterized protein n=1 Tax=Pseudooceanicola antarcticus TaxID=1247613 RepID=A0A285J1A7_9RHOB|nr:hypothetical protein SAMN06297129_2442 [Pseudooceanicola antarcticus]
MLKTIVAGVASGLIVIAITSAMKRREAATETQTGYWV